LPEGVASGLVEAATQISPETAVVRCTVYPKGKGEDRVVFSKGNTNDGYEEASRTFLKGLEGEGVLASLIHSMQSIYPFG